MQGDWSAYFVLVVLLIIFILVYLEVLKPALSFLTAVLIFTVTGIINTREVLAGFSNSSIASIILLIVSGAGALVAGWIIDLSAPYGKIALLIGIILITNLLTSFVVNVGAISITFPISLSLCQTMGMDPMPFFLGIAYSASGAFLTPIGYQTNMIIYGPGSYRFSDFIRIGLPVSIIYLSVAFAGILYLYRDELL